MVTVTGRSLLLPFFTGMLLTLFLAVAGSGEPAPTIPVTYYGDISCAHCDTVVDGLLPDLEERYQVVFSVESFDIMYRATETKARDRLARLDLEFRAPPVLFVGNNAYQGNYAIDLRLPEEIRHYLEKGRFRPFDRTVSETRHPMTEIATRDNDPVRSTSPGDPGVLRYFWGVGCPHCEAASPVIERLERQFPHLTVERYEVFETREHHDTFRETLHYYGSPSTAVPQIFFEEHAWVGFSPTTAQQIEDAVQGRMVERGFTVPFFGTLSPDTMPAAAMTATIAFVDGFNPCSLWVLTLLLGLIVHTRSRRRIAMVGGVFLLVTAAVYGLFILGLLSVFSIAGNTLPLRLLVAAIAVTMGLINVKDYFFFKRGLSLTIPERFQRRITVGSRLLATATSSWAGLAAMTALFAAAIAIVELPCTAGFPVIWSRYVTTSVSPGAPFLALLGLYLAVYLALEILIVATALVTMGRIQFNETQARPIKLAGGAIMISLGAFYVVDPEMAGTLSGVGTIFLAALAGAILLMLLGRVTGLTGRPSQRRQPDPAGR